jgi:tripartite ATP-independent transporter DctP family solute receptor
MKRNLSNLGKLLSLVLMMGLIFAPALAIAGTVTIKLAHVNPADIHSSQKGAASVAFKNIVEAATSGDIKVELYPAGQLGGERELAEACKLGTIQIVSVSGVMASYFKPAMVADLPYLFSSAPVAWKVFDGEFGDELAAGILKATGMRKLAYGEIGFRNFTNSARPIKSPADMKGLKFRVMETPLYVTLVKALGALPTPIAWPEVYTALQQKVVDGQENPVAVIKWAKFSEVQKYLTLDGHTYGLDFLVINDKFFQSLSPEHQKIITRAGIVFESVCRGVQQLNSAMGVSALREEGFEIYSPTSAEKEQFRQAAQGPVIEWMKTQIDPAWIEKLLAAVNKAEAEIEVK